MKSDLFSEFKLCKRLSTSSHHPRRMGADIHVYGVGGREESESREHIGITKCSVYTYTPHPGLHGTAHNICTK